MAKYNVLVVCPSRGGVEYHRQLVPHAYLRGYDDFDIAIINEIESDTFIHEGKEVNMDDFLKNFHLVQFSRTFSYGWNMEKVVKRIHKAGCVAVLDIDDYWNYGNTHLLYNQHLTDEVPQKTLASFKLADYITTTTSYFADVIKLHNKNVEVLENAINPDEPQFKIINEPSSTMRFGWMGSQCHILDVGMIASPLHDLAKTDLDYKIVEGGAIKNDVGKFYTMVLTSNGKLDKSKYEGIEWKDTFNYATTYNKIDIVLAPLVDNKFNRCKSEIKLIEAGFMKKGAIVSKIATYTMLGVHKKNCLMVKPNKQHEWLNAFKFCINNPNAVSDMADQLHEDVKERYHIKTVTDKRAELYKRLIDKA